MGKEQADHSQRIFADMIANNFKYPKGFEPTKDMPNLDIFDQPADGPHIEEVGSDDLD